MNELQEKILKEKTSLQVDIKKAKAAARWQILQKARGDLIHFTSLMMPHPDDPDDVTKSRYDPQVHHRVIAAALESVERGEMIRLIITMPPRAGKSQLAAKCFIPWCMGRDPYREIIFTTYSETFAEDTGRSVRDTMKNPVFQQIFPLCQLRPGSAAADRVQTKEGGLVVSVGAGGTITGRGADLLIIDDPIKDREQADSSLERNKQWEWFTQVALLRLMTSVSSVIIITTRWHEDDIVGRLTDPANPCYDEENANMWKILALPGLATENEPPPMNRKEGEALWEKRMSRESLLRFKKLDPRGFAALIQGQPSPEDGDFFERKNISYYKQSELPRNLRYYCASDHAVSTKEYADKTCLITVGLDEHDNIYVLPNLFWERADAMKVTEAIISRIKEYQPMFWWAENGHISKAIGPFLKKRMREEKAYCAIIEKTPIKDKLSRAQSIQGRLSMGKVFLPGFAPWVQDAVSEMLKFPAGRNDDFVDAISWIGIGLNVHIAADAHSPKEEEEPRHGTFAWLKRQMKYEESNKKSKKDGF